MFEQIPAGLVVQSQKPPAGGDTADDSFAQLVTRMLIKLIILLISPLSLNVKLHRIRGTLHVFVFLMLT